MVRNKLFNLYLKFNPKYGIHYGCLQDKRTYMSTYALRAYLQIVFIFRLAGETHTHNTNNYESSSSLAGLAYKRSPVSISVVRMHSSQALCMLVIVDMIWQ